MVRSCLSLGFDWLSSHNQFDPNTVFGSVMGSAFIFIWFGVLIIGIFIKQKLKKK